MRNVCYLNSDGHLAICKFLSPIADSRDHDKFLRARGDIPADWVTLGYDVAVPESRERRDQWRWENGAIVVPAGDDLPSPQDGQPVED